MKRAPKTLLILLALLCCAGLLKATLPQTVIGKWTAAIGLSQPRANAASVILPDGRILITGGDGGSGSLQSVEVFGIDGSVSPAAAMNVPRSRHLAVVLNDGRVLVGGGVSSGGGATNSAEIYDSSADTWTKTSVMAEARANATAALLQDGRVLIAGGDNSGSPSNTLEIFDPSNGSFAFAGTLSAARTKHAMAVLKDGRVLIVAGFDGTNPLASTDIFDPSSGSVSVGPTLATARYSASATTLLNGQVAVIGGAGSDGNGGTTDLASAEVFDPSTGAFTTAGVTLTTAREAHQAYLLPKNNSVLIIGGTSSGSTVAASELFTPQASPSSGAWTYAIATTGSNATPRSAATGSAMQQDGLLLAAGGTDASANTLASTELYAFPTVKTDQADYPPGTTVNITGSGFQPNETVTITLVESPLFDTHGPYTVTADGNGNISDSSFTTDIHDENVRFWLSATGSQSGLVAQNTFTDAGPATSFTTGAFAAVVGKCSPQIAIKSGGTQVDLTTTSAGGKFFSDAACTAQITSVNPGQGNAADFFYKDTTIGSPTITITNHGNGTDKDSQTESITPAAAKIALSGSTADLPSGSTRILTATIQDSSGATVTTGPDSALNVTFSQTAGSGTVTGLNVSAASAGVATVTVTGNAVGSVTIAASASGANGALATGTGNPITFSVVGGTATKFVVSAPASATAGTQFSFTVTAQDANGNTATGYAGTVKFTSTDAQASLPAISTLTNGTGTFNTTLKSIGTQTITATDTVTATITGVSGNISVTAGAAAKLVFGQQPSNALAGSTIAPPVTVLIQDQLGNATTSTANVTLAIGTNPSSGTLSGTATVAAIAGTATFNNLSINNAGSGYTLTAASTGLAGATSTGFNIDSLIAFSSTSVTYVVGMCSPQGIVQRQNAGGAGASLPASETVALSANITGTAFFSDATCQNALAGNNLSIGANQSSASFFFKNTSATALPFSINITATKNTFVTISTVQAASVIPNISFANPPGTSTVGLCSPTAAKIVAIDGTGTTIAPVAPIAVNLATSSPNGAFFSDNGCTNPITTATIPSANKSGAMPFYKDNSTGMPTLTTTGGTATATTQATVNKATAAFSNLSAPTMAFGVSPTTFSGTVNKSGTVVATGSVTISIAGTTGPISQSATLDANGNFSASIATGTIPVGTYVIQYSYPGDSNFNAPTPNPNVANSLTVTKATTSTTVASSANPSASGQSVTFTATVAAVAPGSGNPTGTVTFKDGANAIGTGTLSTTAGVTTATFSTSALTSGSHSIIAVYVGDTNFSGSTSSALTQNVLSPPSISKAFGAATIPLSGTTSLTFTITNPAGNTVALNGLAFTDTLPAGLQVAGTPNISNACGGTFTASAGSGIVNLSAGTVAASNSCSISLNVTGTTAGVKPNTTGNVTSTNGGTGNTASASITVDAPPTISKAFGAAQINLNTSTSLTFTITNPNTTSLTGITFTDNLPAGLVVSTPNGANSTCTGTTVSVAGSGSISLSSATLAGSASCTITVNVTGTTTGMKVNTTGAIASTEGATGATSNTATLNVVGIPPTITSGNSTTFIAGIANSFTVTTGGTPAPALTESGSLDGLSFTDNGNGTATISGTATVAGSFPIIITAANAVPPDAHQNFTLNVVAGAPASIGVFSGSGQSATVTIAFANPLVAKVQDSFSNPVSGATVIFGAPASEPSGSFAPSATATTDANGLASASLTANKVAGSYAVTASTSGVSASASFLLTNNPGAITSLALNPPSATIAAGDTQAFTAVGFDTYGNMVTDVTSATAFTITAPGSCSGASCGSQVAGTYTVTGTYNTVAQGFATLTVNAGVFTKLQLLVPGETAAPGTDTGKTGTPAIEYVNEPFKATVNAVDQYSNVVSSVTDTIDITSNDTKAKLPLDAPLVNGAGTFSITPESVSYKPNTTTITATDTSDGTKTDTSPAIEVIVVYTATIAPTMAATGDPQTYTLTVNNAAPPNTNNLESVQVAVPSADQGVPITGVAVLASNGGPALNWTQDTSKLPGTLRFSANSDSDALTPGGTITITFMATSNAVVTNTLISEEWTTISYSDGASDNPLPLAPPEPTVQIGTAANITSADNTSLTYGAPGTFSVTSTGTPTLTLSESGALPGGVMFTDNGGGNATIAGTPTAAGKFPITITAHNRFGPDATQKFTLVVNKADSVSTVVSNAEPSVFGQSVTFTATVSAVAPATGTPTGTVQFMDGASLIGTPQTLNAFGKASLNTSTLAVGSHSITAVYGGDNNFNKTGEGASNAIAFTQDVNKADTSSTAVSSVNPSVFGQLVTFTATVSPVAPGAGTPTGTVQFMDGANPVGSLQALDASGHASFSTTSLAVATHYVKAVYSGDGNFNTSTSVAVNQVVNKADSSSTVASSLNPSVYGQSVTFTATVIAVAPASGTPGGTVQFMDGTTTIGSRQTLDASGHASYSTSSLNAATHSITAVYCGDGNFNFTNFDAASTANTLLQVVNKADAVIKVTPYNVTYDGNAHTATSTITGVNGEALAGLDLTGTTHTYAGSYTDTWTFTDITGNYNNGTGTVTDSIAQAPSTTTVYCPMTVIYNGMAQTPCTAAATGVGGLNAALPVGYSANVSAGPVTASASFRGDANHTGSLGSAMFTINPATTATTVGSLPNPSNWTQVVTITATVVNGPAPNGTGTPPVGSVNFYNAPSGATCSTLQGNTSSTVLIGTGSLSAAADPNTSTATTALPNLPVGTDTILACYNNFNSTDAAYSGNFATSSGTTPQTVIAAPIVTLVPNSLSFGTQAAGTQSMAKSITICNGPSAGTCAGVPTATAALSISSIAFGGNNPGDFIFTTSPASNCGGSITVGGSCTVNIQFAPQNNSSGVESAFLDLTDNNVNIAGSVQSASVTGAGLSVIGPVAGSFSTYAIAATNNNCSAVNISGNGTVDSFNGATNSGGNVAINGNASLNGGPVINGALYSLFGTTGSCGSKSMTGATITGKAQITGGEKLLSGTLNFALPATFSGVTMSWNITSCPSGLTGCSNTGTKTVSLAPSQYGNLTISGGTVAHVSAGTYNINSLTLTGNSVLYVDSGPVVINLAGTGLSANSAVLDSSGGSILNSTGKTSNLGIYYAGANVMKLSGGSGTYALVYAPNAAVSMTGGSHFYGSIVANTVNSSGNTAIHGDLGAASIADGNTLWLSSSGLKVQGLPSNQTVKLYVTNASVTYTANGGGYMVPVPNAVITFSPTATSASTTWDAANSRWSTLVPTSSVSSNSTIHTFFDAVAIPVPAGGFPNGIQNVSLQAAYSTTSTGFTFNWQWGAAVYSGTMPAAGDYSTFNVNPLDSTVPAGTPVTYEPNLLFGDMGPGYVGMYEGSTSVVPTIAPASIAPSSWNFGTVSKSQTGMVTQSFTLSNNQSGVLTMSSTMNPPIVISGTNAADFSWTSNCPGSGATITGGSSCAINITYSVNSTAGVLEKAKLSVYNNAANSPQTVFLQATGAP